MSNNKQSSVDWLFEQYKLIGMLTTAQLEKAKAMHKEEIELAYNQGYRDCETNNAEQAQQYAEFCVQCDRQGLPLLEFNGWINLERNEQQ